MGRHPIDHQKSAGQSRLGRFLHLARREGGAGGHAAVQALSRRGRGASTGKLRAFVRIERGARA